MTELSMHKGRNREIQLQQLKTFLREQSADDILSKIQRMPLEKALKNIVERGSDELVTKLLDELPWVLGEKYVARYIAQYRGDEVCIHMIDTHPEVLKYWSVARYIAQYRGDKVSMYIIDNYPETLKYVAFEVAAYRGDEVCIHMIDTHPEVLDNHVAWAIAENRGDEVNMHMIDTHPEVLDGDVAQAMAKNRGDEVCIHMIEKRPDLLKDKEASWAIPEYRSDKVSMYIIDNYPETLKYVAWAIARYRSDEVFVHMIDKYPDLLKDVDVPLEVAEYRGDEAIKYIIDNYPEMLRMERFIYALALSNRSKVLTYSLLRLGEIKSNDVELITSQFSVMLSELYDDYKKRVMKQLFFNREAIDYGKELNSMGPLYLALLDMLNISKESAKRLTEELSKAEGNVKKALPLRGLAYALSHGDGETLNRFIDNSTSVMDALNLFPNVCELRDMNIIDESEFQKILNSEDKEKALFKQLKPKVERTFNVKRLNKDAINAMSDYIFLDDLFGLYANYEGYKEMAETVLIKAAKHYFEGGIDEFKKFKFGGLDLASKQLSDAYTMKGKLRDLDKLSVTYTSKHSIPYDSIKNDIDNFLNHKDELLRILNEIENDAKSKLSEIAKAANSEELVSLLKSKDLDGLTKPFPDDDEKVKRRGIAQIKLLKARESLTYINNIAEKLQEINGKPKEEQDITMEEIAKDVAQWVDKGLGPLSRLKDQISRIKQQTDGKELDIAANALDNAISIVDVLRNYNNPAGGATITAQITFDLSKILTFGRYGSSGAGNCQNSTGNVELNQTLMSMVGDANQFMIMFQKANDTTRPLGFMQVHLLKSNKGMIFFMEDPYTNEPDKTTAMKEAASMLAQKIKNETGFDCFTYGEVGDEIEELEVEVPESYVQRYIDFVGELKDPESFQYKIRAKCLTSHPLFGLKRE